MSLTPSSSGQARAYARLIEDERGNGAWWKRPAHFEPASDEELKRLARQLSTRFMAANWPSRKVHESRYKFRRANGWKTRKAA